jgi:hypothetical protein
MSVFKLIRGMDDPAKQAALLVDPAGRKEFLNAIRAARRQDGTAITRIAARIGTIFARDEVLQ